MSHGGDMTHGEGTRSRKAYRFVHLEESHADFHSLVPVELAAGRKFSGVSLFSVGVIGLE